MGGLVRLLVIVILIGVAVKYGVVDQLGNLARDAALQSGATTEQVEAASAQIGPSLSLGGIMAAIGSLPSPWGAIGKLLFVLVMIALALSIVAAIVKAFVSALRWVRDLAT